MIPMNHPSKPDFYIGIDPGTTTGMCIYHRPSKKICTLQSGSILEMIFFLKGPVWWDRINYGQVFMRIEDARLRKWIPRQKTESSERGRREGAGYVKAHCAVWEDFCVITGIPFELVAPKNNRTKIPAGLFKKLTGWEGRTNGHERDCAMLVFGF